METDAMETSSGKSGLINLGFARGEAIEASSKFSLLEYGVCSWGTGKGIAGGEGISDGESEGCAWDVEGNSSSDMSNSS